MSKKYVSPILKRIEQVKASEDFGEQLIRFAALKQRRDGQEDWT